jgi:hypothetical protein
MPPVPPAPSTVTPPFPRRRAQPQAPAATAQSGIGSETCGATQITAALYQAMPEEGIH